MSNYYEILELESTATQAEIKTAIDEKYAYWNSLASHHDPQMVEKATREKRQLEEIRAVLGSKAKRKKYDNGVDENIGGLAEQTRSETSVIPMRATSESITQPRSPERLDAWVCPKCRQVNTIGQKFCCKCGGQIGEECPQCKHLSQIVNAFCPRCGTNKAQVVAERKQEEALERIKVLQDLIQTKRGEISEIERLRRKIPLGMRFDKANASLHKDIWGGQGGLIAFIVLVLMPALCVSSITIFDTSFVQAEIYFFITWFILSFCVLYLARVAQRPQVIKKSNKIIQVHTNAIAQMVQEIRQLQAQS